MKLKPHQIYKAEFVKRKNTPNCWYKFNETYSKNIYLVFGQEKKMVKTWPFTEGHLENDGFCFENSAEGIVIWLSKKDLSSFAHEVVHAVNFLMKSRGLEHDFENDEPVAYLHNWFFNVFSRYIV